MDLAEQTRKQRNSYIRLTVIYIAVAIAWIALSGKIASRMPYPGVVELIKGSGFVLVTAFLFYKHSRRQLLAISESRELLQTILNKAPIAIVTSDMDGNILNCNDEAEKQFGFSSEEFKKKRVFDLLQEADREDALEKYGRLAKRNVESYRAQRRYIKRDGSLFYGKVTSYVVVPEPGMKPIICAMIEDVTREMEAYQALCESEAMVNQFLRSDLLGVFQWELSGWENPGVITDCNDAFARMVGYSTEEIRSRRLSWTELFPAWASLDRDSIAQMESTNSSPIVEREIIARDGRMVPVLLKGVLLERNPLKGISFVLDMSTLRQARERADALEAQLAKVERTDRTNPLQRLAGGIAHDFNNLLMLFQTSAELLGGHVTGNEEALKLIGDIRGSVDRGSALTKQMMAFSRQYAGPAQLVDLNRTVAENSRLLRRVLGEKVDITTEAGKDVSPVLIDPAQIARLMINLGVAARDSMPEDGKFKVITLAGRDLSEGAAPESILRVEFSSSRSADEVRAEMESDLQGSDAQLQRFGLSTIASIVHAMEAELKVESLEGREIRIEIAIPRGSFEKREVPTLPIEPPRSNQRTILVCEDEEMLRKPMVEYLSGRGYRVLSAPDGLEALRIAEEDSHVDLLVTDVIMPRMDGQQLGTILRERKPGLKIIFMTGHSDARFSLAPGDIFLQKPFSMGTMLQAVENSYAENEKSV